MPVYDVDDRIEVFLPGTSEIPGFAVLVDPQRLTHFLNIRKSQAEEILKGLDDQVPGMPTGRTYRVLANYDAALAQITKK